MAALPRDINRRIGRAMHTYDMLSDGDKVIVAVSGGVDSLVLAWVLNFWRSKAPIFYELLAVHVDMEPDGNEPGSAAKAIRDQLSGFEIPLTILPARWHPFQTTDPGVTEGKDICFTCARNRRQQLFDFAGQNKFNKIALGHHRDDIIETFFLNICYAGNISTMVPRQDLFDGSLALIRPMSFLDKTDIITVADILGVTPVRTVCPVSEKTRRLDVRHFLERLYTDIPESKKRIFAALSNVRHDYLLTPRPGVKQKRGV